MLFCETQETKKLLCKAEIVEWDRDKSKYIVVKPDLYIMLLERLYGDRNIVFDDMLKNVEEMIDQSTF